jgi:Myb/SANT-like DNA-binding domain
METEIQENIVEFSSTNSKRSKSKKRERKSNSSSERKKKEKKHKKQKLDSSSSKKKKAPVRWSAESITTLLNIVRDAVVTGRVHTDSGFKKKDWSEFTNAFHKQTGLAEYDQQQLQSKLSYLKTKFVRLMVIKSLSGIGWCGKTSLPIFSKDEIDAFCAPPGKEKYRASFIVKLDDFDLLHDIFRGKVRTIFN